MIFCPILTNKKIAAKYKEMEDAVGEIAAKDMWSKNNGYSVEMAPNGEPSILFQSLLDLYDGDRELAIQAKSKMYSIDFMSKYGDWVNLPEEFSMPLDKNGEPVFNVIKELKEEILRTKFSHIFDFFDSEKVFTKEINEQLNSGSLVSSKDIINSLLDADLFYETELKSLANILRIHDIPIVYGKTNSGIVGQTVIADSGAYVVLNKDLLSRVSGLFAATTVLHECMHAISQDITSSPKTELQKRLNRLNSKLYGIMSKIYPEDIYSRLNYEDGYYMLLSEDEFLAVFATDSDARNMIYETAARLDNKKSITNVLKNFINSIINVFANKNLFKTNIEKFAEYKQNLIDYITNKPEIIQGNIEDKGLLRLLYNSINQEAFNNDNIATGFKNLHEYSKYFKKLNVSLTLKLTEEIKPVTFTKEQLQEMTGDELRSGVIRALMSRIASVNNSNKPVDQKIAETQTLETLISRFQSKDVSLFKALSDFLRPAIAQITEDLDYIGSLQSEDGRFKAIAGDEYMNLMHDKFGTYLYLFHTISNSIGNNALTSLLEQEIISAPQSDKVDFLSVKQLKMIANDGLQSAEEGIGMLKSILYESCAELIRREGNKTHDLTTAQYIDLLMSRQIDYDTSSFFTTLGSLDGAKDTGLRMLHHIVDKALSGADKDAFEQYGPLILAYIDARKQGISVKDIYEHVNGKTTLNVVLPFNKGLHDQDYQDFILLLNEQLDLDKMNKIAPEDKEKKVIWNSALNAWHRKHSIRRYLPEYYEKFSNLSAITKDARDAIAKEIAELRKHAINKEIYDDNYYHYDLLSKDLLKRLDYLYMRQRLLKSLYDENGLEKRATDLEIAQELQQLDEDLKTGRQVEHDVEKWREDRNRFIESHGGMEAYENNDDSFDWDALELWDRYNSKEVLKKEGDEILLFKTIDEELGQYLVYEYNGDGGKRYEEIKEELRQLKRPHYNQFTSEIDATTMTIAKKSRIIALERELEKIKRAAKKNNATLRALAKKRRRILSKYATFERTKMFKEALAEARRKGEEYVIAFLRNNGTGSIEENEYRPFSFLQKLVVRPEYKSRFVDFTPGDGYIKKDTYLDPRFKKYEKFGMSIIPNGERYNNEKAYNKVKDTDLYKKTLEFIRIINELYKIKNPNLYRLPGITGGIIKRMRGSHYDPSRDKFNSVLSKVAKTYLGDKAIAFSKTIAAELGFSEEETTQDRLFSRDNAELLEDSESEMSFEDRTHVKATVGTMPDNREIKMIPRHYINKLEDPSTLTYDLIYSLMETYRLAKRFSNLQEIKNDCEMLYDMFKDRKHYKKNREIPNTKVVTSQAARNFLDMNLYGIRQQRLLVGNWTAAKTLNLIKRWGIALNLGIKPSVAVVGMLTSECASLVHSLVGIRYGFNDYISGWKETQFLLLKCIATEGSEIAESKTSNKLCLLANSFNLADSFEREYKDTHRGRINKAIKLHSTFGFMTLFDTFSKSHILVSTLMGHRYFGGEFASLEDIRNSVTEYTLPNGETKACYKMTDKEFKHVEKEFEKCTSAYEAISVKDGKLHIENKELKDAYNRAYDLIKQRVTKYAEDADGMATETQKAMITATMWGSLVMMHRQYFPKVLLNYFGNMVYDENTQQWNGGNFRVIGDMYKMIYEGIIHGWSKENIRKTNFPTLFKTTGLSALTGLLFAAPIVGTPIGLIGGATIGMLGGVFSAEKILNYLSDTSTQLQAQLTRARRKRIKKVLVEVALYKTVVSQLSFLLSYLFALLGGDKDDDDSWITRTYWLSLYILDKLSWEFFNAYRFDDMANSMKSASAVQSSVDAFTETPKNTLNFLQRIEKMIMPRSSLSDTLLDNTDSDDNDEMITSGIYKYEKPILGGPWYKSERALFKEFPIKNLYEELYGSKWKDRYFRNQIMHEDPEKTSWIRPLVSNDEE